jgi:hypothetical protein
LRPRLPAAARVEDDAPQPRCYRLIAYKAKPRPCPLCGARLHATTCYRLHRP